MAMRLANLRLRLDDLDGRPARDRAVRASSRTPAGSAQILANAGRGWIAVREGDMDDGRRDPRHDARPGGEQPSPRRSARPGPARHHGGAARRRAGRPRRGAQERDRRLHRCAGDQGHADPRRATAPPRRGWPWPYDRCEDAAELLGAAARVRGIEDPTDPTIAELLAALPTPAGRGGVRRRIRTGLVAVPGGRGEAARPRVTGRDGGRAAGGRGSAGRAPVRRGAGRPSSASGTNTTSSPAIHTRVQMRFSATGPPTISPRTVLTRWVIGLTLTKACIQPGSVDVGT